MDIQYKWLKGLWQLVRIIPVISWSGAGIITTMLPILLYYQERTPSTLFQVFYLLLGGVGIQGILAHAFNDLMDDQSGTDHLTTGRLSGGSRVMSSTLLSRRFLKTLAYVSLFFSLLVDGIFFLTGEMVLGTVLFIGILGAVLYSIPPIHLSYFPFIGEWLCAFVSITALSLTPALLTFNQLPAWAVQNALLHGLWSLSWLMFHHISDVDADRLAKPIKNTTVVFFEQRLSFSGRRKLPAILYLIFTGGFDLLFFKTRPLGISVSLLFAACAIVIVISSNTRNPNQHAKSEMKLILLSVINALWLGFVPFT